MDLEGSAIVQRESWLAYQWLLDQMQTHGEGVLKDYFLPAHTMFIKAASPEEAVRLAYRNHLRKQAKALAGPVASDRTPTPPS